MTTSGNETPAAPVANLRQTRKEMTAAKASAKAAHPAGKQTPAKAPAKKAAAKKQAAKGGTPKLRWQFPSGFAERATTGQTASFGGGELAMNPGAKGWTASFTKGGKTTVLAEGVGAAKAYDACLQFAKKGAAA